MFKIFLESFQNVIKQISKGFLEVTKSNHEIFVGVARILLGTLPFYSTLNDITKVLEKNRSDIDQKIEEAHYALDHTSKVLRELEEALTKNTNALAKVKSDYERFSTLTEIQEEQANALLSQVAITVNKGKVKERWIAVFIGLVTGLVIFLLGIWLGPIITDWLNITN